MTQGSDYDVFVQFDQPVGASNFVLPAVSWNNGFFTGEASEVFQIDAYNVRFRSAGVWAATTSPGTLTLYNSIIGICYPPFGLAPPDTDLVNEVF